MCDDVTEADLDMLSRRQLGAMAGVLALAVTLPAGAAARAIAERDVQVTTPDGSIDAYFVAPAQGKHPGVIIWPDIYGLRPAMRQMGKRLAEAGYAVIVVNPFYRSGKAPVVTPPGAATDAAFRGTLGPMRALLTPAAVARDAVALVSFLDAQKSVDKRRKIGTSGYCMGGPLVIRTAAAVPARIGAGATFHHAPLATEGADSPHLLISKTRANFLIAAAQNDDARDPGEKDRLRAAFAAAKRPAEIEVYPAMHGWCPPDGRAHDPVQAERAWSRMLVLFKSALV